jgi:hypothetical protein
MTDNQPTPGQIRYRLRFLRATYGSVINTWPTAAQLEYLRLQRQLRQLEASR